MRREGDMRPDTEVKQSFLDVYFPDKTVINKVYDDRPSVIRMWRENGLDVEDVGKGKSSSLTKSKQFDILADTLLNVK